MYLHRICCPSFYHSRSPMTTMHRQRTSIHPYENSKHKTQNILGKMAILKPVCGLETHCYMYFCQNTCRLAKHTIPGVIRNLRGNWFSLLVRDMTPISFFFLIDPSLSLSCCSRVWEPPSGPTGTTRRPPGFSWSCSYVHVMDAMKNNIPYMCTCVEIKLCISITSLHSTLCNL